MELEAILEVLAPFMKSELVENMNKTFGNMLEMLGKRSLVFLEDQTKFKSAICGRPEPSSLGERDGILSLHCQSKQH